MDYLRWELSDLLNSLVLTIFVEINKKKHHEGFCFN